MSDSDIELPHTQIQAEISKFDEGAAYSMESRFEDRGMGEATIRLVTDIEDGERFTYAVLDVGIKHSQMSISLGSPSNIRDFADWLWDQAHDLESDYTTPEDVGIDWE